MARSAVIGALRVNLAMDAGEFSRGVRAAEGELDRLSGGMKRAGARMAKLGGVMTAGLTAPLALFGKSSLDAAKKFEAGMSNVATLIDTTTENMGAMGRQVLDIARRTPVEISGLTEALFDVRSAGIGAGQAMEVLEQSARLGVAGLGTTKQAVDLMTSAMNAFGDAAGDAEEIADAIFKTTKNGKTTIAGLAQGFGAVAGTVANAGVKLDEYLASVSALTTTGLPAAQAHTQLRAVIAGLTRETKETSRIFRTLGAKDFKDLIEKSGGLVNALAKVKRETGGSDSQMLKLVGSTEALNAVIGLTGAQNESFRDTLRSMRDGVREVDAAFEKQNDTIAATQQRMENAVQSMSISIGRVLAPVAEKLANIIAKVADAFTSLTPAMQKTVVEIGAVAAAAGPALVVLGGMVAALGRLIPLITKLGQALFWLAARAGPIAAVVATITTARAAMTGFADDVEAALAKVNRSVGGALDALRVRLGDYSVLARKAAEDTKTAVSGVGGAKPGAGFLAITNAVADMTQGLRAAGNQQAALTDGADGPVKHPLDDLVAKFPERREQLVDQFDLLELELNQAGTDLGRSLTKPMVDAFDLMEFEADQTTRDIADSTKNTFLKMSHDSQRQLSTIAGSISSILGSVFGDSKAAAIASAIINTAQAVTLALATIPPPGGFAAAAAAAAAGAAEIATIKSTNVKSKGGGGRSISTAAQAAVGTGGGQAQAGTGVSQGAIINIHGDTFGRQQVVKLIEQINDALKDGAELVVAPA